MTVEEGSDEAEQELTIEAGAEKGMHCPDDSHIQQQVAAEHVAAGHINDHDSLYDSH